MKFSFMTFSCPELTLAEVLETAQRYGYEGIEPRIDAKHRHGIEPETTAQDRKEIRKQVTASGIALACIASSARFADPETAEERVARTRLCIELASDLGAPCVRVFGGTIPEGISRQEAINNISALLAPLAEYAYEKGVTLCMETHDDWCNPADVASVMKIVDHPGLSVNWDIMHPIRRASVSIAQSFETLRPWITHCHVHDGVMLPERKLVPIGQGDIDHKTAVKLLKGINFNGFLSGEWISWAGDYDVHLPRELATLKEYAAG